MLKSKNKLQFYNSKSFFLKKHIAFKTTLIFNLLSICVVLLVNYVMYHFKPSLLDVNTLVQKLAGRIIISSFFISPIVYFFVSYLQNINLNLLESNTELVATHHQLLATEKTLHETIDELYSNEKKLLENQRKYKLIFDGPRDAIWDWDLMSNKLNFERAWELLGHNGSDHSNTLESWHAQIHRDDLDRVVTTTNDYLHKKIPTLSVKYRAKRKNGSYAWLLSQGQAIWDEEYNPICMAGSHTDITDEVEAQSKIERLAFCDLLTELPNKHAYYKFLSQLIADSQISLRAFSLLLVNVSSFHLVNDSLGHPVGNAVLQNMSKLLADTSSNVPNSFLARFGGSKFIIIIPNRQNIDCLSLLTQRILKIFSSTIEVNDYRFHLTANIGTAAYPKDGSTSQELTRNVESAMNHAKEFSKNGYAKYSKSITKKNIEKLEIKNELQDAIKDNQFVLYYQPIVNSVTGRITAAEALIRWIHPSKGLVSPALFIPIAEETGQIIKIGEWVIKTAIDQYTKWETQGLKDIKLHINLSVLQLHHSGLYQFTKKIIESKNIDPQNIVFEITESVATSNFEEAVATIEKLKSLGIHIALDDFGTGYSSLSYASRLPIDNLKIDKSFIDELVNFETGYSITKLIIELCDSRNIYTTSEGVETDEQRQELIKLNCTNLQGYLFSRPLPSDDFIKYYKNNI